MITFRLPGLDITRTIDNDFNLNDRVNITFENGVKVFNKRIERLYLTFTGIYYYIDGFEINQDNEKIKLELYKPEESGLK